MVNLYETVEVLSIKSSYKQANTVSVLMICFVLNY